MGEGRDSTDRGFMKEISGLMEIFPMLIEGGATRVYIFVKIHLTVHLRSVYFATHKMYFNKEKREQSTCIQNNITYFARTYT